MGDLTLILATQRVGSTYFETGVSRMGGLGKPWEHFVRALPELRTEKDPDTLRALFEECLEAGRDEDGHIGVTIMADYFNKVAGAGSGRVVRGKSLNLSGCLEFWGQFAPRFENIHVFYLTRDLLDQALSQLFSERTRLNHILDGEAWRLKGNGGRGAQLGEDEQKGTEVSHDAAVAMIDPNDIIRRMARIAAQYRSLEKFIERAGLDACTLDYAQTTTDPEGTAARIMAHTGGAAKGLDFAPSTEKVVPSDASQAAKARLASFLELDGEASRDPDTLHAAALAEARKLQTMTGRLKFKLRVMRWKRAQAKAA